MSELDDILDTPEKRINWDRMRDETALESSPCTDCESELFWGFRFCIFCGTKNEHYDPDYDDFGDDCGPSHAELREPEQDTPVYCSLCGGKIV